MTIREKEEPKGSYLRSKLIDAILSEFGSIVYRSDINIADENQAEIDAALESLRGDLIALKIGWRPHEESSI